VVACFFMDDSRCGHLAFITVKGIPEQNVSKQPVGQSRPLSFCLSPLGELFTPKHVFGGVSRLSWKGLYDIKPV